MGTKTAQTKTKLRLAARRRREDRIHEAKMRLGRQIECWNLDPQSPIWEVCLRDRDGLHDYWRYAGSYIGKAPTLEDACKRALALHSAKRIASSFFDKKNRAYEVRVEHAKLLGVSSW